MFDWRPYLLLAERLARETEDEAALRSAISRAYYAAYHTAALFVRARGLLATAHSHREVWRALVDDSAIDRVAVGRRDDRLKQMRLDADYRTPFPGTLGKQVEHALIEARGIIEALDSLA